MKKCLLLLVTMLILTMLNVTAQNVTKPYQPSKNRMNFTKKSPPYFPVYPNKSLPGVFGRGANSASMPGITEFKAADIKKDPKAFRQMLLEKRNHENLVAQNHIPSPGILGSAQSSDFHITKDINALAESFPANFSDLSYDQSYAILNNIIYFAADDGIHGIELWRSDGTDAGTYMVKDIEPGLAASFVYIPNITALNGKLYFSAATSTNGLEPWMSDGTESGTHLLKDIAPGLAWSFPTEFVSLDNTVYFVTDDNFDIQNALWQTDGTEEGTKLVKDLGAEGNGGFGITQLTAANGLLFFTFASYTSSSWELWRTNGKNNGTYHVGTQTTFAYPPAQLTSYDGQLYFSADEGSGRKLWKSNGTDNGTKAIPYGGTVIIDADYFGINFPVLNNVLYLPGYSADKQGALFKYDASDKGLVKIKDLSRSTDLNFIVPSEMTVAGNMLYFKVTSYNGGFRDELWCSDGLKASTSALAKFLPGESIGELYNGNNMLYFMKYDRIFGSELWQVLNTPLGKFPIIQSDVFSGGTSSNPQYLTAFKGKVFFSAASNKGTELFMTDDIGFGATLVKDINTVATSSSFAGTSSAFITSTGNEVFFDAFENVGGDELYKSDGTQAGTGLLNDILPGEISSSPQLFASKNGSAYFVSLSTDTSFAVYKTDGTAGGLKKMTPDYVYFYYGFWDYVVADNGLVFYILYNGVTGLLELWRSDGTGSGTVMLSSAVSFNGDYLNIVGNTAFFAAWSNASGFELWKSDGTVSGTQMVKDINPGIDGSDPGGLYVYKNDVYFGAYDGKHHGFWKSDGTKSGTIRLKNIDPWWGFDVNATDRYYFEVSNGILYFTAINRSYKDSKGTQLWKTDGTAAGTEAVKDISPNDDVDGDSTPYYFTDVDGMLFFIGNEPEHGAELWTTNGTKAGTQLVKDITAGPASSGLTNLVRYAGKLYFTIDGVLWSSDGTKSGTRRVDDAFLNEVFIYNLIPVKNKLFVSGYTHQYGVELYAGRIDDAGKFVATTVTEAAVKASTFNATLYPNPAVSSSVLRLTGDIKNVSVSVMDMSGKKIWQANQINVGNINLPSEKFAAGNYIITVTNGNETKSLKLVKQ